MLVLPVGEQPLPTLLDGEPPWGPEVLSVRERCCPFIAQTSNSRVSMAAPRKIIPKISAGIVM